MKDLNFFEDAIKALVFDDGQNPAEDFTVEIFTHLKQLLVQEGKLDLGKLGTFLYQERKDSAPKIAFMPSSHLRQALNKKDWEELSAEFPVQSETEGVNLEDNVPEISYREESPVISANEENAPMENEPEKASLPAEEVIIDPGIVINQEVQKTPLSTDTSTVKVKLPVPKKPIPEPEAPNKPLAYMETGEERKTGSRRIWYIILMLLLLIGLSFGAYKIFGQQHTTNSGNVFTVMAPGDCIAYETLRNNETLLELATKYYGNSCYWVYIFLENKQELQYKGKPSIQTSIRIPQLDDYGISDPKELNSIKRALALGNELRGNSLK